MEWYFQQGIIPTRCSVGSSGKKPKLLELGFLSLGKKPLVDGILPSVPVDNMMTDRSWQYMDFSTLLCTKKKKSHFYQLLAGELSPSLQLQACYREKAHHATVSA